MGEMREGPVIEASKHRWLRVWQPKEVFIANTVKAEAAQQMGVLIIASDEWGWTK